MAGSIWQRTIAVAADGSATITSTSTQLTLDYDSDSHATITVADASNTTIATGESGDLILDVADDLILDASKVVIGTGAAADTYLNFDGHAQDYRIGLDDGSDKLEVGVGTAHGTTTAFTVDSSAVVNFKAPVLLSEDINLENGVADTKFSGITANFIAGEDLEDGECVYLKASDGKVWKAVATAAATSRCIAMCTADTSADATGTFLLQGFAHFATNFPTYTVGGATYTPEAETSGKNVPEQAAPDTDGDFVQVIGWAMTANILYFNPSNDIIEVA